MLIPVVSAWACRGGSGTCLPMRGSLCDMSTANLRSLKTAIEPGSIIREVAEAHGVNSLSRESKKDTS